MKTDAQLKSDVVAELAWDPAVDATHIGVAVEDGVVTLSGTCASLAEKYAAEKAVRRVAGVRGAALDLDISVSAQHQRSDAGIAEAAVRVLDWDASVPSGRVKVEVEDGWVTLAGEVDGRHQRMAAERAVRSLVGVRGLTNNVVVTSTVKAADVREQITAALARHARRQADHIAVDIDGGVVTLTGEVDSLAEHDAAIGTAFAANGVSRVVDRLHVAR